MMPELRIEGACLVLWDAYTATVPLEPGDAVKVTGGRRVAGTQASGDECVGLAYRSALPGQMVPVVVAGLFRTRVAESVQRGDVLVPADQASGGSRGRARRLGSLGSVIAGQARRHAVAVDDQAVPGRPVWVHLRVG